LDHTEAILRQGVHCSSSELRQGLHAAWIRLVVGGARCNFPILKNGGFGWHLMVV